MLHRCRRPSVADRDRHRLALPKGESQWPEFRQISRLWHGSQLWHGWTCWKPRDSKAETSVVLQSLASIPQFLYQGSKKTPLCIGSMPSDLFKCKSLWHRGHHCYTTRTIATVTVRQLKTHCSVRSTSSKIVAVQRSNPFIHLQSSCVCASTSTCRTPQKATA